MGRVIKSLIALAVCVVALLLPYRARLLFFRWVSFCVHLPFVLFGKLGRFLLERTGTGNPYA